MTDRKPRVLFLCTGNAARSQMAEAFLRQHAGDRFEVHSAGLEPKGIHPLTFKLMEEVGISLVGHRSKNVLEYFNIGHIEYLITVCSNAEEKCPTLPGVGLRYYWPFTDPADVEGSEEERMAAFREIRDQIEARILRWLDELEM